MNIDELINYHKITCRKKLRTQTAALRALQSLEDFSAHLHEKRCELVYNLYTKKIASFQQVAIANHPIQAPYFNTLQVANAQTFLTYS